MITILHLSPINVILNVLVTCLTLGPADCGLVVEADHHGSRSMWKRRLFTSWRTGSQER